MEPTRIFDFISYQLKNNPLEKCTGYHHLGKWTYLSTQEVFDTVQKCSNGLLALGVKRNDKIGLIAYKNRPEWLIMDLAIQQIGAIVIPIYPTISSKEYEYIFNDAGVSYVFVGDGDLYDKVEAASAKTSTYVKTFTFDKQDARPYWKEMWTDEGAEKVKEISDSIKSEDLATIIYTSGTTGNPKGVMLSHSNIVNNAFAVKEIIPIGEGKTALSFLPICHIFERTAALTYLYLGISVVFTGTDNLGGETGDLRTIKPHFFSTVPRLLEKVYEKIYNKGLELTGTKKKLFFWALSLTDEYEYNETHSGLASFKRGIADKLIFSKWREALGGNVEGILTGAAPCPPKMLRVFSGAGIPVREGYGLTETSPGLTMGRFINNESMIGTVGPPIKGVDIFIDSSEGEYLEGEGEILAHGKNVMMGYYNMPEKTAEVMKEIDGKTWFCTGDIGKFVTDKNGTKHLKITDRKKELLKTSGGKYVAPAPIESKLKEDFLIEQVMVIGDKQKYVSALIVPSSDALKNFCKECNVPWTSLEEVIKSEHILSKYQEIIDRSNPEFSHIEQIKRFALLSATWDPIKEDGSDAELTPTLKLKRRVITEKYKNEIAHIYI